MYKIFCRSLLLLIFCAYGAFAQTRITQSINTNWGFYKGDNKVLPTGNANSLDWQKIQLPHSWNTADVKDDEPGYYRGICWYKKTLYISPALKNKSLYLYFEGANQVAEVYVNGKLAGQHSGGYTAFSFPINQYLNSGTDSVSANEILVKLDNSYNIDVPPISADFTFYGGIYRDVYLLAANPVHFDMDSYASAGVQIKTPAVNADKANILIEGALTNLSATKRSLKIVSEISNSDGKLIVQLESKLNMAAAAKASFSQTQSIGNPHLWSTDDPYLYHVVTRIYDSRSGELLDECSNPLGCRWFSFDAEKGFFLNGKPLKLIGANRHQDYKDIANALPNILHQRDIELLKNMGANFIRVAHYPQDPALMEACDRLGILASVEIPIVNQITESEAFTANCLQMQTEMIRQNFNHPSVIIWTYMNEVILRPQFEKGSERQKAYFASIVTLAKALEALTAQEDPSRYTMIPFNADYNLYSGIGLTKVPRIVGWNIYSGWYGGGLEGMEKFLDARHTDSPDKPIIITEYGADADARIHNITPERFDKSIEYQVKFHVHYFNELMKRPFVAGAALWNLVDFNSEARAEATPHVNTKGITTDDRIPKDSYYYYKAQLAKQPFIKIATDLWKIRSGTADANYQCRQPVSVYSNLQQIKLWVNGQELAVKNTENGMALFDVPFKNGENKLKATAVINGSEQEDNTVVNFNMLPAVLTDIKLPFQQLNVSLGDKRYFIDDKLQQVWLPEQPYSKGNWGYIGGDVFKMENSSRAGFGSNKDIFGTDYDAVFETQRIGIEAFKADVPDGSYEVTLHFAELQAKDKGQELVYNLSGPAQPAPVKTRSFDVLINGATVINGLNNNNYLTAQRAYSTTFKINAQKLQGITVSFKAIIGQPVLNAIQIKKIY